MSSKSEKVIKKCTKCKKNDQVESECNIFLVTAKGAQIDENLKEEVNLKNHFFNIYFTLISKTFDICAEDLILPTTSIRWMMRALNLNLQRLKLIYVKL